MKLTKLIWLMFLTLPLICYFSDVYAATFEEYPSIKLRSLDKITARTLTFDAQVGSTIKFGDIYIKVQSCRKPPPIEKTEAAAFLQIWQVNKSGAEELSRWVYSGWMFASSPALAAMNHPVYDVWVIDCIGKNPEETPVTTELPVTEDAGSNNKPLPDEGEVKEETVPKPQDAPENSHENAPNSDVENKPNDQLSNESETTTGASHETETKPSEPLKVEEEVNGIY